MGLLGLKRAQARLSWCTLCKGLPGRMARAEARHIPGGSRTLPTDSALAGQLELKQVQVERSWSASKRRSSGKSSGAVVGLGLVYPAVLW